MPTQETQVGTAKIFGLIGGTAVTLVGAATVTIENADLEHKFKLEESIGQDGNCETLFATNEQYDIAINFMPNGATRAAAATSAANMIPAPLSKVVLSGFAVARYNGDYNYVGGATIKMVRDKECVMNIKLRAYIANRASLTSPAIVG